MESNLSYFYLEKKEDKLSIELNPIPELKTIEKYQKYYIKWGLSNNELLK